MSTLEKLSALGAKRKVHAFEYQGVTLYFRGLNHVEKMKYRDAVLDEARQAGSDNLLISMALCEADGKPALEESTEAQIVELIASLDPMEIVKPLIDQILMASGIGKAAEDQAAKN